MARALLIALALLVSGCAHMYAPDPMTVAEDKCRAYVNAVIDSGACDDVENLLDCPDFMWAMRNCQKLFDTAKRAQ